MNHARGSTAVALVVLAVGCTAPGPLPPSPPASASPTPTTSPTPTLSIDPTPSPSHTLDPSPSRGETRRSASPEATPSLPVRFPIRRSLLDGGAAVAVRELHEVSGLRPALKLDVSRDEVKLTVLTRDLQPRSYRWRDGIIDLAETDVQYLHQSTFWPTDFALENVRRIFDVAALLGTSSDGQMLQVVEYRPGQVFMSVSSIPETSTIFFRKDGTVFRSLDTSSVADIRDGIKAVTTGARPVLLIGFDAEHGYYAELPGPDGTIERRSRMQNRPTFSSRRTGTSPLTPFDADLVDPSALAQVIALHDRDGKGCAVEIDNRFNRVQPVATYQCDGRTFHSDLRGTDITSQLD